MIGSQAMPTSAAPPPAFRLNSTGDQCLSSPTSRNSVTARVMTAGTRIRLFMLGRVPELVSAMETSSSLINWNQCRPGCRAEWASPSTPYAEAFWHRNCPKETGAWEVHPMGRFEARASWGQCWVRPVRGPAHGRLLLNRSPAFEQRVEDRHHQEGNEG